MWPSWVLYVGEGVPVGHAHREKALAGVDKQLHCYFQQYASWACVHTCTDFIDWSCCVAGGSLTVCLIQNEGWGGVIVKLEGATM